VGASGGVGMVARPRELAGTRLGGGGHGGRRRRVQVAAGGSVREARGGRTFIGDAREPCRRTAVPRPWYGAQGGTPRGPSVRRGASGRSRRGARRGGLQGA
jgi:hypothetical protein